MESPVHQNLAYLEYILFLFPSDITGLQDIQTDLATLIGEQADDIKLIGMYSTAKTMRCDIIACNTHGRSTIVRCCKDTFQ